MKKWTSKSLVMSSIDDVIEENFSEKDPIDWVLENFGIEFFSNQLDVFYALLDKKITAFNVLACRGAGKSFGVVIGLAWYCMNFEGLRVIVSAPKASQAGRLLKEITSLFKTKKCKVSDQLDWAACSAHRLEFKNGSYIVALSGQEGANIEGEHGHILVIDEAHLMPSYSVTNKLMPMIGMLDGFKKVIKIGLSMGKNHFFKSCSAEASHTFKCPWQDAEIFLTNSETTFMYRGVQYSKNLVEIMPLEYKKKYFPDRPDLHVITGQEISVFDWETQYEIKWNTEVGNFLSDSDQELLASGQHRVLSKASPGEFYCAGLDTAQGSITGHNDTDETVLSIWRLSAQGQCDKVASYFWKGDPAGQIEDILEIIKPGGVFPVELSVVDYSNIGIAIVALFQKAGIKIIGKHFQAVEPKSRLNWKNAMYDYFLVQLQQKKVFFPNIEEIRNQLINYPDISSIPAGDRAHYQQLKYMVRGFWQWETLQRIPGKGLNDIIQAPDDNVEDEDTKKGTRAFDDACTADIMGVWALGHYDELLKEFGKTGDLSSYVIPTAMIGAASSNRDLTNPNGSRSSGMMSPILDVTEKSNSMPTTNPGSTSYLSDLMDVGIG